MESRNIKRAGGLTFKRYDVDGGSSVSFGLGEASRGIYAYHFTDGTWYVGKSVDMAGRYTQHLHEYRHYPKGMPDVSEAWFASVDSEDPAILDEMETRAIGWFEASGHNLRNKAKTNLPQGSGNVSVLLGGSIGISLPWKRAERPLFSGEWENGEYEPDEGKRCQFEKLLAQSDWPRFKRILRSYILATIPAPDKTAGVMWAISAYPSGRYGNTRRYCTLTIQNLETLVLAYADDGCFYGFLNMKRPKDACVRMPKLVRADYRAAKDVLTESFTTIDGMLAAVDNDDVCDWCYRLNIELMRKGGCMVRQSNNQLLARAVLE